MHSHTLFLIGLILILSSNPSLNVTSVFDQTFVHITDSRPVLVGFVVNSLTLGQILSFYPVSIIPPVLQTTILSIRHRRYVI